MLSPKHPISLQKELQTDEIESVNKSPVCMVMSLTGAIVLVRASVNGNKNMSSCHYSPIEFQAIVKILVHEALRKMLK